MTCRLLSTMLAVFLLTGAEDKKEPPALKPTEEEKTLLELINKERVAQKLPALEPNQVLFEVARGHSANMAKQGKMDHVLDGKNPAKRVEEAGYKYQFMAENVAFSTGDTLANMVKGWMDSKVHRENILREGLTQTGVGIARNAKGEIYYTQVFGTPQKK